MKFGGTSVGDVAAFERVIHIVSTQLERKPVVVVSAITRFTDALLEAFAAARAGDAAAGFASLELHFERHVEVRKRLLSDAPNAFDQELEYAREELRDLLVRVQRRSLPLPMLKDAIVSYGEQLSSRLVAEVLESRGVNARQVDSRRLIVTDDEFGHATPVEDETNEFVRLELDPLIAAGDVPIMGGFIAANRAGETTTLGRGGSDYSAAIIAAALNARELQIWTDVTGVMPRRYRSSVTRRRRSWRTLAQRCCIQKPSSLRSTPTFRFASAIRSSPMRRAR
jgi:aspartate kinase